MKTVNLTPVELFSLFKLVTQRAASVTAAEATELSLISTKLSDAILEILQDLQDEEAADGFRRWQSSTINKIQTLNESMKNIHTDEYYSTDKTKMKRRK